MKTALKIIQAVFFSLPLLVPDKAFSAVSGTAYQVTQGSVFQIDSADFPDMGPFQKAPGVYVLCTETKVVGGRTVEKEKKKYVKVLTKAFPANQIDCEWVAKAEAGTYPLYVVPKGGKASLLVTESFVIKPPTIHLLSPDHGNEGMTVTAAGEFFGGRKPKAWLDHFINGKLKKKSCKILSSYMSEDGTSLLEFAVPKVSPQIIYTFHIKNLTGEAVAQFTGSNMPPVAYDDSATTEKDMPVQINVLANDYDADGDVMTVVSTTQPQNGVAAINGGTTVIYTPSAGYLGGDSFEYTVSDGFGETSAAKVTVTVSLKNTAPKAVNDSATTQKGVPVEINVLGNDSDPDGDELSVFQVGTPSHGTASISSGGLKVEYAPSDGYVGGDSFEYTVSDGRGGTAMAAVAVTVTETPNSPPDALDDSASTTRNIAVEIPVLGNDTDPDGDTLSVISVTSPSHGTASISSNSTKVRYAPAKNFVGSDSFSYTVSDGRGGTDSAAVQVNVADGNTDPVAVNDSATTAPDTEIELWVLANDYDAEGDTLTITSVGQPANGTAAKSSAGTTIIYTPSAGFTGKDSFTYGIEDGFGGAAVGTVAVVVSSAADGEYLIVDLSPGPNAMSYAYEFLPDAPGDIVSNDEYKTTKLVLKKIPAGEMTMGSPPDETGRSPDETQHHVTVSNAFYAGIFEVTQAQYYLVAGAETSIWVGVSRPVESVRWSDVRGGTWPGGEPSASSFAGRLSSKTGLPFDLPTEAQWEYACRAGTTTGLNNGSDITNPAYCPVLGELGWYFYNSYEDKHQVVGQKTPNAWGLYDMHGNVWEWCLDYYAAYAGDAVDPAGVADGSSRVIRGGSWSYFARSCRSAARNYVPPAGAFDNLGFRICVK